MNPSEPILSADDASVQVPEQQLENIPYENSITAETETTETGAKMTSLNEEVKDVVAHDIDGDHAKEPDMDNKAEDEQLDETDTVNKIVVLDNETEETPSKEKKEGGDDLVKNDVDKEHAGQEELKEDEAAVLAKEDEDDDKTPNE